MTGFQWEERNGIQEMVENGGVRDLEKDVVTHLIAKQRARGTDGREIQTREDVGHVGFEQKVGGGLRETRREVERVRVRR